MTSTKALSAIAVGAVSVALGLSLQYALADWQSAPANPPSGNTAAPLNVGSSYQAKSGGITLGSSISSSSIPLDVEGLGYIQALILGKNSGSTFQYLDGNQGSGRVLTSDASGNATWQALATTTATSHGLAVFTTTGISHWTAPAGVTSIDVRVVGGGGGQGGTCTLAGGHTPSYEEGQTGGNGGYGESILTVTPGQQYTAIVGAGGTTGQFGGTGGTSSFYLQSGNPTVSATGGDDGSSGCDLLPADNGTGTGQIGLSESHYAPYGQGGGSPQGGGSDLSGSTNPATAGIIVIQY